LGGFKSLQMAILTLIFAWGIGLSMKVGAHPLHPSTHSAPASASPSLHPFTQRVQRAGPIRKSRAVDVRLPLPPC